MLERDKGLVYTYLNEFMLLQHKGLNKNKEATPLFFIIPYPLKYNGDKMQIQILRYKNQVVKEYHQYRKGLIKNELFDFHLDRAKSISRQNVNAGSKYFETKRKSPAYSLKTREVVLNE